MSEESQPQAELNGHGKLISDIESLLQEVKEFQFHDFKNTKYPAPKIELKNRLEKCIQSVINGRYDN